jgi:cytochrome c-type biogenesis protein CcmH/NrfG
MSTMGVTPMALWFSLLFAGLTQSGIAQGRGVTAEQGPISTIYGDVHVQVDKGSPPVPGTFLLVLYDIHRIVIGRQTVSPEGRYRFMGIGNGEYDLAVESDGVEVARFHWFVQENRSTDRRQDLTFRWRSGPSDQGVSGKGEVPVADLYKRSSQSQPRYEQALQAAARKEYDKAIDLMKKVLVEDPKDFEAWSKLGLMQFMKGSAAEAENSYARSLEAKPDYLIALVNLGNLRIMTKNFDGAIESLARAVEVQPGSADANYLLGEAYLQAKKGSKAVGYLTEAIRLDPTGKADAHLRLAALYNAAQLKAKAAAEYEQFLAKRPDYPDRKKLEEYIRQNK